MTTSPAIPPPIPPAIPPAIPSVRSTDPHSDGQIDGQHVEQNVEQNVDADRVLDGLVTELELLLHVCPISAEGRLVELYGALLLHALGGDVGEIPSVAPWVGSTRRALLWRVVRAARRIAGARRDPEQAVAEAELVIEDLIALVDPGLRVHVA